MYLVLASYNRNIEGEIHTLLKEYRRTRKGMKDKRDSHGIGKSSSEQHFCKSAAITFIVGNFWSPIPSATGSYGRQLADEMQVNFKIFKSKYSICHFV